MYESYLPPLFYGLLIGAVFFFVALGISDRNVTFEVGEASRNLIAAIAAAGIGLLGYVYLGNSVSQRYSIVETIVLAEYPLAPVGEGNYLQEYVFFPPNNGQAQNGLLVQTATGEPVYLSQYTQVQHGESPPSLVMYVEVTHPTKEAPNWAKELFFVPDTATAGARQTKVVLPVPVGETTPVREFITSPACIRAWEL